MGNPPDFVQRRAAQGPVSVGLERSGRRFVLRMPYDAAFLDKFKDLVPGYAREWAPKPQAVWAVDREFWRDLKNLLREYYGDRLVYSAAAQAAAIECDADEVAGGDFLAYVQLGVRTDAPDEVIHAAYFAQEYAACQHALEEIEARRAGGFRVQVERDQQLPPADPPVSAYHQVCRERGTRPRKPIARLAELRIPRADHQPFEDCLRQACARWRAAGWGEPEAT